MLATLLHHPHKLWLRKTLFQVHLWAGVLLSLYMIIIGLSGAILVFQDEIRLASLSHTPLDRARIAPMSAVIEQARHRFPAQHVTFVGNPQPDAPWWTICLADAKGKPDLAYADPATGAPLAQQGRLFIDWVLDLHIYLLAGRTGFIVNCLMGMGLLLLAITGAVLWWPGIKLWRRALMVSLRHGWRRINFDLHSAFGIWTLAIVAWWGVTAVYFLFPVQVASAVNAISPLVGMRPPQPAKPQSATGVASLEGILAAQPQTVPGTLQGVSLPDKPGDNITLYVGRGHAGDFSHRDIATFDGHTGLLLTVWHYGDNRSLGDWFLWLMYPLHFGTLWGMGVKILWSLMGLGVAVLSVTGLLMYWNRKLRFLVRRGQGSEAAGK